MGKHDLALVPIETWCYSAPELRDRGLHIDLGLLCEALIYYDKVAVTVSNPTQFAALLDWFKTQNATDDLYRLLSDGELLIYDYSFVTAPFARDGEHGHDFSLWNFQDQLQERPGTWETRYLYHPDVEKVLPDKHRHRKKVYAAFAGRVIEAKASLFGPALENARMDFASPKRAELLLQSYLDELFALKNLGAPPRAEARIDSNDTEYRVKWNLNFGDLTALSGPNLRFHPGMPLSGAAISNRLLWSAAMQSWDLFLASPLATLVGDKLAESERELAVQNIVGELEAQVDFPDVRGLINAGRLPFSEVLRIRKGAVKFRSWLQTEGERDRDAIIAYHHEVAQEGGFRSAGRKFLRIFGALGGSALGAVVGSDHGIAGAALGGVVSVGATYVTDVASKMGEGWKPIVFGQWFKGRIKSYLDRSIR